MNLSQKNILDIAGAVASIMAQAQNPTVSTTSPAPVGTSNGRPRAQVTGADYAMTLAGNDGRPRMSKELFASTDKIVIIAGGQTIRAQVNAEGRSRLPVDVIRALSARKGDTITLHAVTGAQHTYEARVMGRKASQTTTTATVAPQAQDTGAKRESVDAFFAGTENTNYPVGDPRRTMTRAQRKAFNRSPEGKALFASGAIKVVGSVSEPKATTAQASQPASTKKPRTQAQKDATARMLAAKAAKQQPQANVTTSQERGTKVRPQYMPPTASTGKKGGLSAQAGKVRYAGAPAN